MHDFSDSNATTGSESGPGSAAELLENPLIQKAYLGTASA